MYRIDIIAYIYFRNKEQNIYFLKNNINGVQHPRALFSKTLCIFSKKIKQFWTKNLMDLVRNEVKNHSFTSVETIVEKLS